MGMNFMGLGFTFGAEDKGFSKQVSSANKSFDMMQKSIAGIGLVAAKSLKMPNLKPAASLVQTMSNDTKITTTQLEAFGVQAHKVASMGLAGLNLTVKEFKKAKSEISSVAFDMNMDIGTVTQSMVALKQSGVDVTKIGFKSFKQFQKFMTVTGTDATKFAANVARMRNQFHMTDEQITKMIQSSAAMGKKLNIGKQAVSGMSETVRIMSEEGAAFFKSWGPDRVNEYVMGTTRVAGALVKMGATADEAYQTSQAFTKQLIKGQSGMKSLFAGLADDMGTDMDTLTQHLGSVDEAFEMLQKGPDAFAKHMAAMSDRVQKFAYSQLRATDEFKNMTDEQLANSSVFQKKLGAETEKMTDRFTLQMTQAFGPGVTNLINRGFGEVEGVINSTQGEMKGGGKVVDEYAKKYSDGRTMAERFAIAEDRLYTRLKKVHGVMSDTKFLKEYQKQTKTLFTTMDGLAKKGGPVGKATQMMIEFANFGVGGVLGKMIGPPDIGLALGALIKKFGPLMTYLPGITAAFKALFSPITLVAGAIAGLYFLIKDLQKGAEGVVMPWINKFRERLPELLSTVSDFVGRAFEAVVHAIVFIFDNIPWDKVGNTIGKGLAMAFDLALLLAIKLVDVGLKLLNWLANIDWGKVGKTIGDMLAKAFLVALKIVGKIIMKLPELIYKAVVGSFKLIMGAIDGFVDRLKKEFPRAAKLFDILGMALKGVAATILVIATVALVQMLAAAIATAIGWIVAWAPIILTIGAIGLALYGIYKAVEWVVQNIKSIGKFLLDVITWPYRMAYAAIEEVIKAIPGIFSWVWDKLKAAGQFLLDAITWPFRKAWEVVVWLKDKIVGAFSWLYGKLGDTGKKILRVIAWPFKKLWEVVVWVKDKIVGAFNWLVGKLKALGSAIYDAVSWPFRKLGGLVSGIAGGIKGAFSSVAGAVGGVFSSIGSGLSSLFGGGEKLMSASMLRNMKTLEQVIAEQEKLQREAEQKRIKQAAQGIKTQKQLLGEQDKAVKAYVQSQIDAGKKVVTVQGDIIDLNESIIHFSRLADGSIKKVAYAAQNMQLAKITKKEFNAARKMMQDFRRDTDAARKKGGDAWGESLDEYQLKFREFKKEYGVDARDLSGWMSILSEQYSVQKKQVAGLQGTNKSFAAQYIAAQSQMADRDAERIFELEKLRAANKISQEEYQAGIEKIQQGWEANRQAVQRTVQNLEGNLLPTFEKLKEGSKEFANAAEESAGDIAAAYRFAGQDIAKSIPEKSKQAADQVRKLTDMWAKEQELKINEILSGTGKFAEMSVKQRVDAVKDLRSEYGKKLDDLNKFVVEKQNLLAKGHQRSTLQHLSELEKMSKQSLEKTSKAAQDAASEIKKVTGISGDEAMKAVGQITNINPRRFKKNMEVVRKDFVKFINTMRDTTEKLTKETSKNLNKFFDDSKAGWEKQTKMVQDFGSVLSNEMGKAWKRMASAMQGGAVAMLLIVGKMFSELRSMAMRFNLLNALSPEHRIAEWANSVTLALARAFMGQNIFDKAVGSFTSKTIDMISELEAARGSLTADTEAAKMRRAQTGGELSRLADAVHNPSWATDGEIPTNLRAQTKLLAELVSAVYKQKGLQVPKEVEAALTGASGPDVM